MKFATWVALAALLLPQLAPQAAQAADPGSKAFVVFVAQTSRVRMDCFPKDLRTVLEDLRKNFGKPVIVTSGHRGARQARRGSQHRTCTAADIRIPGVSSNAIARFARTHRLVGGVGTYCGSRGGMVHVDIGPRRDWHHCGRKRRS